MTAFEISEPGGGIDRFLRYAALAQPIDSSAPRGSGEDAQDPRGLGPLQRVALLSVHSAKGLEWDVVFVVGCEDDQFPQFLARDDEAIAEERRVLYVAMTRARDRLFLFLSVRRNGYDKTLPGSFCRLWEAQLISRWPASPTASRLDAGNDLASEQLDRLRV